MEKSNMNFRKMIVIGIASVMSAVSIGAFADTVEVKGVVTKWDPSVVFIKPGDTVKFTGMAGHDSAAYEGMVPDGAEAWHSKMGDEGFTVTLSKEGAYLYKCTPHESLGMVGAIVVGDKAPANLDAIKGNPKNKGMVGRAVKDLEAKVQAKFAK
jgi:pseudoazurin